MAANHKKHPIFLRIKTSTTEAICINPLQISGFRIVEGAVINIKDKAPVTGDTIYIYYPAGTVTRFTVGLEISQDEFNYVSNTLAEYLYLNEAEFRAKTLEIEARKLAEWNDAMASPEVDAVEEPANT